MLQLESVRVSYGGLRALDGVDLQVGKGEFVAIVGPNGAGKTTLFRAISGVVPSLLDPAPGCRFAPRCRFAMTACTRATPELREVGPGHKVACIL